MDRRPIRRPSPIIKERIRAGEGFQAEIINYDKSGRKYWVAIEVQPIRDGSDQITNFIAVERDITDRKRAERRMEMQHATMQILAGCSRLDEAIPDLLSSFGRLLDFDVAEFWTVERQAGVLKAAKPWTSERVDPEWTRVTMELRMSSRCRADGARLVIGLLGVGFRPDERAGRVDRSRRAGNPLGAAHASSAFR